MGPVYPGPPAATYPSLRPLSSRLTQKAYSEPSVIWNLKRTGWSLREERSPASFQVIVTWPKTARRLEAYGTRRGFRTGSSSIALSREPLIAMLRDKVVVCQMWIGGLDSIQFSSLSRA